MSEQQTTLPPHQKLAGRRQYLRFNRLNGASFPCLTDNILVLYALRIGMPASMIGVLASFLYLSMPFLLLGRKGIVRHGAAKTFSRAWIIRNIFGSLMASAPAVAYFINVHAAIAVLLIGAFGFAAFRSVGIAATSPLMGEVTDETNRGRFASQLWYYSSTYTLIVTIGLVVVLNAFDYTQTFQCIILFGCLVGFVSAIVISRVPESDMPRQSARQPIRSFMSTLIKSPRLRKLTCAHIAGLTGLVLVLPISMAAVKKGYNVPDNRAIFFALMQIIGTITVAYVSTWIADHVGPKPMFILYGVMPLISCLMWTFAPADFSWAYTLPIFFLNGIAFGGVGLAMGHSFLVYVDEKDRVPAGLIINIAKGIVAGLASVIIGSGLIKLLENYGYEGLNLYSTYFTFVAAVIVLMLVVFLRLERVKDWRVTSVLGLLVSPRDIRVLVTLTKLKFSKGVSDDSKHLSTLEHNPSNLSQPALIDLLESPNFWIRSRALNALRDLDIDRPTRQALVNELKRGKHTTAYVAADILGEKHVHDAIDELRNALDSDDLYLQGKTMLALARLGDTESFTRIREIFKQTDNPRLVIHGAAAMSLMPPIDALPDLLAKAGQATIPDDVEHEILYFTAKTIGCGETFYQFLKTFHTNPRNVLSLWIDSGQIKLSTLDVDYEQLLNGEIPPVNLVEKLKSYCDDRADGLPIVAALGDFLNNASKETLSDELIYCLWLLIENVPRDGD